MKKSVTNNIRTVLIGVGQMGRNHLRVILNDPRFKLTAIVDPNIEPDIPLPAGIKLHRSINECLRLNDKFDAAVVAVPTSKHFFVVELLLKHGIPTLVEKPLASTQEQCRKLVLMAQRTKVLLAVGHVERHNPAVQKLEEVLHRHWLGKPIHFSATRVGGYPQHSTKDSNVLIDLAVHDIDILRMLLGPLQVVGSTCHRSLSSKHYDTAEILLRSRHGASASIHVNWITPTKIRTLRVTGTRGVCAIDYMMQTCEMLGGNLLAPPRSLEIDYQSLLQQYKSTDRVEFGVSQAEPLRNQLGEFFAALTGRRSNICLAEEGHAAVCLAQSALDSAANTSKRKSIYY